MSIDQLGFYERVAIGTSIEERVVRCLNEKYGWNLHKSTFEEDTEMKIDYIERSKGLPLKVQAKSRESECGFDFLYDLYEPWRGSIEESDVGRDHKSDFDLYICLSKDKEWIRVVSGKAMKRIVLEAEAEWKSQGCRFPNVTRKGKRFWNSEKYDGVQFWLHRDAKNKRLKVLAFVPEHSFGPKELKKYKMHW